MLFPKNNVFFITLCSTIIFYFQIAKSEVSLKNKKIEYSIGPVEGSIQLKSKPESFVLKNVNTLNNKNPNDFTYLSRSTTDLNVAFQYGKAFYGHNALEFFTTLRNKSTWGVPESIAKTTTSSIKSTEVVFGDHNHFLTKQLFWFREGWLDFSVNNAFGIDSDNKIRFKLGAFPFELGRGIALGSAYLVTAPFPGFVSDNTIDQYAFGFRLYGNIIKPTILGDLYVAILENKMDSFNAVGAKILGQEFGKRMDQARGPGKVNILTALRSKFIPYNERGNVTAFEPYALYNYAPEQKIEFLGDASSKLATVGLAGEFEIDNFAWGFDVAKNFGSQSVKGWDRNMTEFRNSNGTVTIINSQVRQNSATGPNVLYVPGSSAQQIIDTSVQNASENGQYIGTADGVDLYNSQHRFTNPYSNKYKGWMAVADAEYSFNKERTFKVAGTVGYASGDSNPNQDINNPNDSEVDGDYQGFVSLQELYSGSRVQSVFLLGGTGKAPRPLDIPTANTVFDRVPSVVSGFTNIAFVGSALHFYPRYCGRTISVRPNFLAFWQTKTTNAFDIATGKTSTNPARNFLGSELNIFADVDLLKDYNSFKMFVIASVFIPGGHYADIKGTPLNRDELKILDKNDVTGILNDNNPFISNDVAYTFNIGLECRF